jgi:diguanylate cyclase (GGDEF)-like protein
VGLVIGLQAVWALSAALARRHATVGRGQWLLVAGLGLEAVVLGGRAVVAISAHEAATSILQSSVLQTLTFMSTFTVVLVSSMGFVFMARDRADENNRVMAALDHLTGVANRRSLIAALDRDVARAVRMRESIALMMVDIDHFKNVNDQYGHPMGDRVLCSVVNVLRQRVRAQDLVGRYGGEEFMVVLPDTTLVGAEQLARELCKAVEESRCPMDGVEGPGISVTVSIGVFGGRLDSGDSWDMLIAAADRALYQAKSNGRNRVESAVTLRRPGTPMAAHHNPETLPSSLY